MEKKAKVGVFNRLLDWINMLYPFKKEAHSEIESNFWEYLEHGRNEQKDNIVAAVGLCDEALDIVSERIVLINRLKGVEEQIEDVAAYGNLEPDDVEDLKDLLDRYTKLTREASVLKYQVTSFDAGLGNLDKLEGEATLAVPEIKYAEEHQRMFKQDIGYLEGEKIMLSHEKERLVNALDFVYKFTIALVIFFAAASLFLVFLYIVHNVQTILVLSGMLMFVIVLAGLLYYLRAKLRFEVAVNHKKQKRAVGLLNTKTAVYAHFTNYLNHNYRKYSVRNAQMLETNLEEYNHYKHLTKRLDSIRNICAQTEDAIEFFLKEKGISLNFGSIEKFAATIDIEDKMAYHKNLLKEKSLIEHSLKRLDNRNAQIWDNLMAIKAAADADAPLVEEIMDDYVKKAGYLIMGDEAKNAKDKDAVPRINVSPASVRLAPRQIVQFRAATLNMSDVSVVWSIREENGGSITQDGVYTAPVGEGVYTVNATAASDEDISAVAYVIVRT
jgi:hypothetical protein